MYYPCSENKGADQLSGYRAADLRLCFGICKKQVFSCCGSIKIDLIIIVFLRDQTESSQPQSDSQGSQSSTHSQETLSQSLIENLSLGFPTRFDTNWAVQPQKVAGGLKFWILEVEGLYYLCSKNKGADQLHDYRAADLCLCFTHMQKTGFLMA